MESGGEKSRCSGEGKETRVLLALGPTRTMLCPRRHGAVIPPKPLSQKPGSDSYPPRLLVHCLTLLP